MLPDLLQNQVHSAPIEDVPDFVGTPQSQLLAYDRNHPSFPAGELEMPKRSPFPFELIGIALFCAALLALILLFTRHLNA
jgi:hypothetical protein